MAAFWGFLSKKYLRQISYCRLSTRRKYEKVQPPCGQLLKLTQQKCHYFFDFLTLWYLKLRFVLNTFRTKTCKSSHYGTRTLLLVPTTKSQSRVHTRARLCFLILAWFSMSFLLSTSYYFYGNNTLSSPTLAQVNTNSICEGSFSSPKQNLYAIHVSNYVLGLRYRTLISLITVEVGVNVE